MKFFGKNPIEMKARYYAYTGLAGNTDSLKLLMSKAVAGTSIRLAKYPPIAKPASVLQRLKLDGFGVFNCDALRRLGPERITVDAEFVGVDGKTIDARVMNVIDSNINSILRLSNTKKISYNPENSTKMVIVDYFGDAYFVAATELEKNYKNNNKKYHLIATLIEGENTDAVRGAIAQN